MAVANWAKLFFSTHFSKFPAVKPFFQRKNYFSPYGVYFYYNKKKKLNAYKFLLCLNVEVFYEKQ